jgi:hypothetical protein
MVVNEFATPNASTITPHANANGAEAVAAADYRMTPEFGVTPPVAEPFTSRGGHPILFTANGTPTLQARQKPDVTAPDNGNNTFFGGDSDGDGFANFSGTSAAAPHAAGLAALMLQNNGALTPAALYTAMENTALDMNTPGFDNLTGAGLVQADFALGAAPAAIADIGGSAFISDFFGRMEFLGIFRAPERLDLRTTTLAITDLLNDDGTEHVDSAPLALSPAPGASRNRAVYASLFDPSLFVEVVHLGLNRYRIGLNLVNDTVTAPADCAGGFGTPTLRTSFILNDGVARSVVARTDETWVCVASRSLVTF